MREIPEIKLALASTNEIFNTEVFAKRNFDALDRIYTADARILPRGGRMVEGRPAIKEFCSNLVQAVNVTRTVLTSTDMVAADDGVIEVGKAVLTLGPAGPDAGHLEVKYVAYWRKEGGLWKWYYLESRA